MQRFAGRSWPRPATNKHRAAAALMLLTAKHNAWIDADAWTELIRDHLAAHRGRAARQRLRAYPASSASFR